MATSRKPVSQRKMRAILPGGVAAALVAALTLGTVLAVAMRAQSAGHLSAADWAALRFTLMQAGLSALISVGLAIPLARALARRQFRGRAMLITLLGAPFILPVIAAVLGLLAIFGRHGLANLLLQVLGLPALSIYGMFGVVLAHVFFNLPLATRLLLQGWQNIPAERFRLAASLGFAATDIGRVLERPMLREIVPGAFMVVFAICVTSFAVVLALGGGPGATTLELAIYEAVRFDFDLGRAALLALVQFGICAAAALLMMWVQVPQIGEGGLDRAVKRWDARFGWRRWGDMVLIVMAALFLLLPLAAIIMRGLPQMAALPSVVFAAAARSLGVALFSVLITLSLAMPMAVAAHVLRGRPFASGMIEGMGYLAIAASPLVMGLGLFIVTYPFIEPGVLALPLTAVVNAVMSLPFVLRMLLPAVAGVEHQFGWLADSLGMKGWARMRWLYLPRLRRPLGFSAGLAAALSMGDLGAIALFSDGNNATLPLILYRLMGAYRMDQAAGAALLLLGLSLLLFWLFDKGGRVDAAP